MSRAPGASTEGRAGSRAESRFWTLGRLAAAVLGAVLVVELVGGLLGRYAPTRTTPATSPFATGAQGTAGLVSLLRRSGHRVVLAQQPLSALPAGATLLAVDPVRWSRGDRASAAGLVASGGTVVFAGAAPSRPIGAAARVSLLDVPAGPLVSVRPGPDTYGVASLDTGDGVLSTGPGVADEVRADGGVVLARSGAVVWLASSTPLRDGSLAGGDDAALALDLAGRPGATVVLDAFDQVPAAPSPRGFAALATWWQAGLAVAALAGVAWLLSASRRLGPPEPSARALAPARLVYVDAVADLLLGTGRKGVPATAAYVTARAERALRRAAHVGPEADATALRTAAAASGVPDWVLDATSRRADTRDAAVDAGRALAWLASERSVR